MKFAVRDTIRSTASDTVRLGALLNYPDGITEEDSLLYITEEDSNNVIIMED